ncbi:Organic cation/carnitine transporter 4 [Linum grandiflorum]
MESTTAATAESGGGIRDPLIRGRVEMVTIDEMLEKHCGEFGPWQRRHFFLTNLAWAVQGFHAMVMIFADRVPEFRCVDGGGGGGGGGCYEGAKSVCGMAPGSWEWVGGSDSSTVGQFGLVCEDKFKVGLVQAAFFAGCMTGAGTFGHLSDTALGRKGALFVICALAAIFSCMTALAPNYWIYFLLRVLTGFSAGGIPLCTFTLANEPVGPNARGGTGVSTFYFFSFGITMLSIVAYFVQHSWRALYVASSIPAVLFVVLVLPFVSESPRWYLVRGKLSQATKIIEKIAESNGRKIPNGVVLALDEHANKHNSRSTQDEQHDYSDQEAKGSLIDVIRWSVTRTRLFLSVCICFFGAVAYYGLNLNVVNLKTNIYLSVAINAVAETPAFALTGLLVDRVGRKPLAIGTMFFSSVFCFFGSVVGDEGAWRVVRMVCGVLGIFGMAGTYNLFFIYAAELFPTVVRNAALGCTMQATQLAAILAPFIVVLGGSLPLAIFAVCGFVGTVMCVFLPDTLNQPMYDTIAGMKEGHRAKDRVDVA